MEKDAPQTLEILEKVFVTQIEASPIAYMNNPLVTLSKANGVEIQPKFYIDVQKSVYAVNNIYIALMAGLYSGCPLTVQTTESLTGPYRNITNCIISTSYPQNES